MNEERRKAIRAAVSALEEVKATLETLRDEEQDYYDNMPESFQSGEKGDKAQAAADKHGEMVDDLENVIGAADEAAE
jgi:hypothetical protein